MSPIFTIIIIVLALLAILDLIVGVSNDAVNFLNSALGAKVAPMKVILSVAAVYVLTTCFMDGAGEKGRTDTAARRSGAKDSDPMVFLALGALILGIGCGAVPLLARVLKPLSDHTDWLLGLLMFSVGISVGLHRGLQPGFVSIM